MDEVEKACFLFGHADCPDGVLPQIEEAVERHYLENGVRFYYVGNRGRFDALAATAVARVKKRHRDIQLHLVLAYHPSERTVDLWGGFDGSYYPPLEGVPRSLAIVKANQYMVDTSDTLICYVMHIGNTRKLLEYAQRRQKKGGLFIENLAENS